MRRIPVILVLCALATPAAWAQSPAATQYAQAGMASTAAPMSDAEVRKVDKDAGKITLKHGEIRNLGMPPMTMVFQVKDKAMLDQVKAGDKVRFAADRIGGAYTITQIEPVR